MLQITIIGLGIVGGSLGMALNKAIAKTAGPAAKDVHIVGYDENLKVQKEARRRGAVTREARTLEEETRKSDLVIIATPVRTVGEILQEIGPHLQDDCVVTDTASSKAQVLQWAGEFLPEKVSFVGGHPVWPPQHEVVWEAGIEGAQGDLFRDAVYCLVPALNASESAVDVIRGLAYLIGASPFFLGPAEHDGLLAGLSHAPYIVAAAMLHTIGESSAWRDLKLLADPAYRHLNRLVTSRPADFYQTCLSNRQPIISWLDRVVTALLDVRRELADQGSEGEYLHNLVEKTRLSFEDWLERRDERAKEREAAGDFEVETLGERMLDMMFGNRRFGPRRSEDKRKP
jgi:prephenate dehydrogenase